LAAYPAELKVRIEHNADNPSEYASIAAAASTKKKLRAYLLDHERHPARRLPGTIAGQVGGSGEIYSLRLRKLNTHRYLDLPQFGQEITRLTCIVLSKVL
jgi:hypothetical protein